MPRRPIHKAKSSECGGARRGHGLTADWAEVTCRGCLVRQPVPAAPNCRHCRRPVTGRCVHVPLAAAWLHDTCVDPFNKSPEGQALFRRGVDPYAGDKCPRCGRPGLHPDGGPCG